MTIVSLDGLKELYDFDESRKMVLAALDRCQNIVEFVRFLNLYADWNSVFGSAVASLSGKVGTARKVFVDDNYRWNGIHYPTLADRSVLVASHIFEAARDEFDDRDFPSCRATHRCLAQATIIGCLEYLSANVNISKDVAAGLLDRPDWLDPIESGVLLGYGQQSSNAVNHIFEALGFHLGSEILADQEFSIIDKYMQRFPELLKYLKSVEIEVAGTKFPAHAWINIHSGHGKHVEADHFEAALDGTNLGFSFLKPVKQEEMYQWLGQGFLAFTNNRKDFFNKV